MNKHPLADCEACPLQNEPYIPSEGDGSNGIAIVGEAPGLNEAKTGKIFSGPSGKLLDTVLNHYGIDRASCKITNTVACRPPDNRTPTKKEIACCSGRLIADIGDAETIVTLGNVASAAVIGTPVKITGFRVGAPKKSDSYPGVRVIPTFHPAACLRSTDQFPLLVSDFGKINPKITLGWEAPYHYVYDEPNEAAQVLCVMSDPDVVSGPITIDIETAFDKDIAFEHPDHYELLCVGLQNPSGPVSVIGEQALKYPDVQYNLKRLLENQPIVAHNGKFDLQGLRRIGRGTLAFDTMLASYTACESPGTNGLKYLAVERLGAPAYDDDLKRYLGRGKSFRDVPRDTLYRYNAYDVACTTRLHNLYRRELDTDLIQLHDFLVGASNALMDVELEGIKVNQGYLTQLEHDFTAELALSENSLVPWVANPRSPVQIKKALDSLGIITPNTSRAVLEELLLKDFGPEANYFLEALLDYRKRHKLYGTYIKGIDKRMYSGRVYPNLLLHGTTSGRLSCRNPNLQNIPRDSAIKKLFVPAEGNIFIQADYKAAELRVVAALAKDEYLASVFREGRDLHSEVASRFFGPNFTSEQRVRAKMVVFGLTYDMSAYGLAWRMGIDVNEAQRYINQFFEVIPGVVQWRKQVERELFSESRDLVTPFGRHRRFYIITNETKKDILKEGLAFYPQSIASDVCLTALVNLSKILPSEARIRVPVHDSILVECPSHMQDHISACLAEQMRLAGETFTDFVPFDVDIKKGYSWGTLQ